MITAPSRTTISALDRLELIQKMSDLPLTQVGQIEFALNAPRSIMPSMAAPVGERVKTLLDWADGPTGPGLEAVWAIAQVLIPTLQWPGQATRESQSMTIQFVITFSGNVDALTLEKLMAILQEMRSITGEDFLEIVGIETSQGIRCQLAGAIAALTKLQVIHNAGLLKQVLDIPVLSVESKEVS